MLGNVPSPIGAVGAQGTLERFLVQMTNYMDVESGGCGRPEGAVRAFVHLVEEEIFKG